MYNPNETLDLFMQLVIENLSQGTAEERYNFLRLTWPEMPEIIASSIVDGSMTWYFDPSGGFQVDRTVH